MFKSLSYGLGSTVLATIVTAIGVLTSWETHDPVERYNCRRFVWRGRRVSEDTHKRLARRRKGFPAENVQSVVQTLSLESVLKTRLNRNEEYLPEVSASLISKIYMRYSSGTPNRLGVRPPCYTSSTLLTRLSSVARSSTGNLPFKVHRRRSMSTER